MAQDPLRAPRGSANLGSAGLGRGKDQTRWELADVVEYNSATHTAVVHTTSGRTLSDVPQIKTGPGEYEHYKTGTSVVVSYDLGFPAIIGCINFVGRPQNSVPASVLTGVDGFGDDNPLRAEDGAQSYKPAHAPRDMMDGDWARVGPLGNHVAVMDGGVTLLGAPTSQVRSLSLAGVLQLVAQQLQAYTDFGEWKTQNDGGKTSFILRAGSNQATQTGIDEENWGIRLDLGATGDLFNFEITEPQGRTLFKMHVAPDGRLQIFGDNGIDISTGAGSQAEFISDVGRREVHTHGQDLLDVNGPRMTFVQGVDTLNLASDQETVVGGSDTRVVEDAQTISIGGKRTDVIAGGGPLEARPGDQAITTKVLNGGWMIDIGNPRDGANVSLAAAFHLRTSLGSITFESGGKMDLKARQTMRLNAPYILMGGVTLSPLDGVVTGRAIDTFTGSPQYALGNASKTVRAKK